MYIKKIIIEGFRTYRNKTVLCLEPGLNVIVGRNGSGKTNLLCAIQFVLAHDYYQLSPRERQNMLHISAGFRATSAYVEILFSNEDRRLPEEGNEVSLRREITSSKDVFYLNGNSLTKEQVLNTLESAGLSRINPYYIIRQGRINDLATATDKKRLEQFTEIAGSLTWKELQPKNDSLLKETENRMKRLQEIIEDTQIELEIFERDEQLYRNWSETNTKKRVLELLLGNKEKERLSSRITSLKKSLDKAEMDLSIVTEKYLASKKTVTEADLRCKSYLTDFRAAEDKLKSLKETGEDLVTEHSKLELELEDRKSLTTDNAEKLNEDLSQVENEISLQQNELSVICDDYNSAVQEEYEINTRLVLNEQRRKQLFAKLGRGALFATVEERNQWIQEELSKIYSLVVEGEEKLHSISEDMSKEESKAKRVEKVIKQLEAEKVTSVESLKTNRDEKQRLLLEQKRLQMSRNELRRKESELREQWKEAQDKLEQQGGSYIRRSLSSNLRNLRLILDKMVNEGEGSYPFEMASQYRGLVIEQFTYESGVDLMLDAVAGDKLFHSVVDTSEAANEILRWINREPYQNGFGLPGTFCFYSRDRINCRPPISAHGENAVPLFSALHPVQGMKKLVWHIFGQILVCESFESATELAKRLSINCVTVGGDRADWNGVLKGGYRNLANSRSKIYFETLDSINEEKTKRNCLQAVEEQMREIDCNFIEIASQLQRVENKISQTKLDTLEQDLMKQRGAYSVSKEAVEGTHLLVRKLKMSLEANRAQIKMLEEELQQEFVCELGTAGRAEVDSLHREIDSAKKMYRNANVGRLELEGRKKLLESRLNDHLMRKKRDLEQAILEKSVCGLTSVRTETNQLAIRDIEEHLRKLESLMNKNKAEIGVFENKIAELSNSIVAAKNEFDTLSVTLEKQLALLEKYKAISNKIDESIKRNNVAIEAIESNIVSLGTFDEQNEKNIIASYSDYNVKRLEKELDSVNDGLKRFKNVNHNATLDYKFTSEKLRDLNDQMIRLRSSHDNCWDLLENVENTKNDAVVHSFMQVARSFRRMFRTLVPRPGIGYLKWTYDDGHDSESDYEGEGEPQIPDLDGITGIAVKVSFTASTSVQNLNSLSGGQRSVVSLALIFAILMMDRAPFYLLDEADMALDEAYRTKVAAMVDKFSRQSQFIAITFRPELLKHADNIIGVSFDAATQTSRAVSITKEEANDFVSSHGSASSGGSSSSSNNSNSRSTCSSDRTVRLSC